MADKMMMINSWPRCIMHLDADAFFVSVEQSLNPTLRGKAVITGAERGIVSAASYVAKRMGVGRGISLSEAKKICPHLICLPSDYETYSIFSERMFDIIRRFTPVVEAYSIDEAFADLGGLRRLYRTNYVNIAQKIKTTVEQELGITVSVGLSLTKSLAKLASKLKKPAGMVAVPGRRIHELLALTPLEKVWGFGPNTVALLHKQGLRTALDFVQRPELFAKKTLGKIGVELHQELSGQMAYPLNPLAKQTYASISKTKTFTPPSMQKDYVFAQALRNLESACLKMRRYHLQTSHLTLFLKNQNFNSYASEVKLNYPTAAVLDLVPYLKKLFEQVYQVQVPYRASGVVLSHLKTATATQLSFFEDPAVSLRNENLSKSIDMINDRYGKHKIHLAESLPAQKRHEGTRAELPGRKKNLLPGESFRQRLGMSILHYPC